MGRPPENISDECQGLGNFPDSLFFSSLHSSFKNKLKFNGMALCPAFFSPITEMLTFTCTGRSFLPKVKHGKENMYTYKYRMSIPFKLYCKSELFSCLLSYTSACKCHYSGISSSCCIRRMLLLHYLLLSKVWEIKKWRVLILCSLFSLTLHFVLFVSMGLV